MKSSHNLVALKCTLQRGKSFLLHVQCHQSWIPIASNSNVLFEIRLLPRSSPEETVALMKLQSIVWIGEFKDENESMRLRRFHLACKDSF